MRSTDRLIISIWKESEESSRFDEIHRSRTFSKFRFETRADRSDRFGQARFREIPRRLCIGVSRWMDPCPVIREPLSGARDRTTLGQTSAPIIVLTVQLYTYVEWSVHTACPENSSIASLKISPAVLFSSRNYACNLHSAAIKFLNGGKKCSLSEVNVGTVGWKIIKSCAGKRFVEDIEETFLLLLGGLEERHVRQDSKHPV